MKVEAVGIIPKIIAPIKGIIPKTPNTKLAIEATIETSTLIPRIIQKFLFTRVKDLLNADITSRLSIIIAGNHNAILTSIYMAAIINKRKTKKTKRTRIAVHLIKTVIKVPTNEMSTIAMTKIIHITILPNQ